METWARKILFFSLLKSVNGLCLYSGTPPCTPGVEVQDIYHTYGTIVGRQLGAEVHVECFSGIGLSQIFVYSIRKLQMVFILGIQY